MLSFCDKGFVTHVTVLVGIAYNGIPIGGVIHQPFLENEEITGRTLWGIPGVGYGGFTVIPPTEGKRIVTTTTSHSNARVEAAVACLKADDVIRVGGAGYKAILLMEGKANAYVFASPGCKKWDTCAPEAILTGIHSIRFLVFLFSAIMLLNSISLQPLEEN